MFDKWLKLPAHYYLKITALTILAIGICLHNTLMSIGTIWIMANWLIEAKFKDYWENFKKNPVIWFLLAYLVWSFISLSWSDNVAYGLDDIRKKLPFYAIIFVLGTSKPIPSKIVFYLLYVFLGVLTLTSVINFYRFNFVIEQPQEIRGMSFFISHIRYSTLIAIGTFAAVYLIIRKKFHPVIWLGIAFWLLYYTYRSQVLTGYMLTGILSITTFVYIIFSARKKSLKFAAGSILLAGIVTGIIFVGQILSSYVKPEPVSFTELETYTRSGRTYFHDTSSTLTENGNYIWIYVCPDELRNEWNKRSSLKYDELDHKGQPMFGTLIRYMTSKNLRKDSVGVWQLSDNEVSQIENGVTSINLNQGIENTIHAFLYQYAQYQEGGDPNGHSILQRLEHLKIASLLVGENWLIGTGLGDVDDEFKAKYASTKSKLLPDNWHRSHNQFMTSWISLGLPGLIFLLLLLLYPLIERNKGKVDYLMVLVLVSLLVSLFFQDMLETQAGVTIFALFYGITVFRESHASTSMSESKAVES